MTFTAAQKGTLDDAVRDAYRNYDSLQRMLAYKLDRRLSDISAQAGMKDVVFHLIESAEAEGWLDELATGALIANPGNPALRQLYEQGIFAPSAAVRQVLADPQDVSTASLLPYAPTLAGLPPRPELESLLRATVGFLDVVPWATGLLEQASRVCLIEIDAPKGTISGTGFLVGPDVVLTNHHVVAEVVNGQRVTRDDVAIKFDYALGANGLAPNSTVRRLAEDWLVTSSPPSDLDFHARPTELPTTEELDLALLRLDGCPGRDPMPGRDERGWLDLTAPIPQLIADLPLLILQHPGGASIKIALDTEGVIEVNANSTRVTYRTNTLPGSSGSSLSVAQTRARRAPPRGWSASTVPGETRAFLSRLSCPTSHASASSHRRLGEVAALTPNEKQNLDQALRDAFPSFEQLARFMEYEVGYHLRDITSNSVGLELVAFKVIEAAESDNWLEDLVCALAGHVGAAAAVGAFGVVRNLAQRFGCAKISQKSEGRLAHRLADPAQFDLYDIETHFWGTMFHSGSSSGQVIATAIACDDLLFVASLERRIETVLKVRARPRMQLDGLIWTADRVFQELRKLETMLRTQAALCLLSVDVEDHFPRPVGTCPSVICANHF